MCTHCRGGCTEGEKSLEEPGHHCKPLEALETPSESSHGNRVPATIAPLSPSISRNPLEGGSPLSALRDAMRCELQNARFAFCAPNTDSPPRIGSHGVDFPVKTPLRRGEKTKENLPNVLLSSSRRISRDSCRLIIHTYGEMCENTWNPFRGKARPRVQIATDGREFACERPRGCVRR